MKMKKKNDSSRLMSPGSAPYPVACLLRSAESRLQRAAQASRSTCWMEEEEEEEEEEAASTCAAFYAHFRPGEEASQARGRIRDQMRTCWRPTGSIMNQVGFIVSRSDNEYVTRHTYKEARLARFIFDIKISL